jgi:hypothetical protein
LVVSPGSITSLLLGGVAGKHNLLIVRDFFVLVLVNPSIVGVASPLGKTAKPNPAAIHRQTDRQTDRQTNTAD